MALHFLAKEPFSLAESKRDYYDILGVSKDSSEEEIKKAYRVQAKKFHPDLNPDDKTSEQKFKEANEAYEVLSDPKKKAKYDQFGHAGVDPNFGAGGGAGGFGGFDFDVDLGDIFGSFFGGGFGGRSVNPNAPRRGEDLQARVTISFEEAAKGTERTVNFTRVEFCSECSGTGAAKGSKAHTCSECGGTGHVNVQQRTPFGVISTSKTCPKCGGKGKTITKPCSKCQGGRVSKKVQVEVEIPAGIDDGQVINMRGEGNKGANEGPSGNLHIAVLVRPHPFFERDGYNVWCEVTVSFMQAALGDTLMVPTLDGKVKYDLPAGTQPGTIFVLKSRGIQNLNSRGKGDQLIRIIVEVPKQLSSRQKELIKQLDQEFGNNNENDANPSNDDDERKGFFGKKKK